MGIVLLLAAFGAVLLYRHRGSTSLFAVGLLLVVVCLTALGFLWCLNMLAQPKQGWWAALAAAMESSTFKAVSVSLVIPLGLALVASNLKVLESIRQSQVQREQKARDDAVQKMLSAWAELSSLSTKIAYFPSDGDDKLTLTDYRRLLRESKSHLVEATANVNLEFSHTDTETEPAVLTPDDIDAFVWFCELVLQSSESTAWYLEHLPDGPARAAEEQTLQDQLKTIQDGVAAIVDEALSSVLGTASHIDEVSALQSGREKKVTRLARQADERLDPIAGLFAESVQDFLRYTPTFSNLVGDDAALAAQFKDASAALPDEAPSDALNALWNQYLAMPPSRRVEANNVAYSREYLEHLAAWMDFVAIVGSPPTLALSRGSCITIAPPTRLGQGVVTAVPCDAPHDAEVFETALIPGAAGAPYPGDDEVRRYAVATCSEEKYDSYVNVALPSEAIGSSYYAPTEFEWTKQKKRQVTCLIEATVKRTLTTSVHRAP